jgi:pilus assembly protein Flp/PilA
VEYFYALFGLPGWAILDLSKFESLNDPSIKKLGDGNYGGDLGFEFSNQFKSRNSIIWEGFTMSSLMVSMVSFIAGVKNRFSSEKGATAVEYGLMVSLIAVVIIVAVALIGTNLDAIFDYVGGKLVAPAA